MLARPPVWAPQAHTQGQALPALHCTVPLYTLPLPLPPTLAHVAQILLYGWGEVAHSVAMRANEISDLEWAVKCPELGKCTGWVCGWVGELEAGRQAGGCNCSVYLMVGGWVGCVCVWEGGDTQDRLRGIS